MLQNIELVLLLFLLFYLLILFYDFSILNSKRTEEKRNAKKREYLIDWIVEYEKTKDDDVIKKMNRELIKKLKSLEYLYNLETLLKEDYKIAGKSICEILNKNNYENIFTRLARINATKDNLTKAFYAYILRYILHRNEEIESFLFKCLSSSSIYAIENTLFSFYYSGNSHKVVEAYKYMNRENIYYNHKLISDGMMSFKGDRIELCEKLYENFDDFNEDFQIGFLTYFRNVNFKIEEGLLSKISERNMTKEVEISAIRYFSKINYKPAINLFVNRLNTNYYGDYDYDVVMLQILGSLKETDDNIIDCLKKCLASRNYYVRFNATKILHSKLDLRELKDLEDRFTKDMIEYFISQEVQ